VNNIQDGIYSYKFSGRAFKKGYSFHLVGIGKLYLKRNIISDGFHSSSIVTTNDVFKSLPVVKNAEFSTSGSISEIAEVKDVWKAEITFTQKNVPPEVMQILKGYFTFCTAGPNCYSVISTGAEHREPGRQNEIANEVVSGDIIRIGDISND
jgi:uncharacterized protein YaiE (UPF0345 family)